MDNPAGRPHGPDGDGTHIFNFTFMFSPRRLFPAGGGALAGCERNWPCFFLSNHDNPCHISRYAAGRRTEARARVAGDAAD